MFTNDKYYLNESLSLLYFLTQHNKLYTYTYIHLL